MTLFLLYFPSQVSPTPITNSAPSTAFASFYYVGTATINIADATSYGAVMPFNRAGPSLRITVNPTTNTWTHALPGTYVVSVSYRQNSGGDLWTVLAVTKNGNSNAVGVSPRTASIDARLNMDYRVVYTVDSTTATYQLQHWSTSVKTVCACFGGGPPTWGYYSSLCGGLTG